MRFSNVHFEERKRETEQGSISSTFYARFFVRKFVQSQNITRKKAFIRKTCAFNVDEINHRKGEGGELKIAAKVS